MATILNQITVGEKLVLEVDAAPGAGAGTPAPVGSLAMLEDTGPLGTNWIKVGPLDTDWDLVITQNSNNLVDEGLYRRLAIYDTDASGTHLDDILEQNGFDMDVRLEAQPTRTAAITYQIPNPGDAITAADFVLTEGVQSINGDKTFQDNVTINGDLDVNGTLTSIDTVNTTIQDKLITLNKNGAAASAGQSGIELEEDGAIEGYIKTSTDREKWCLNAPAFDHDACLDFDLLSANQEYSFPDESGTFLLQPTTITGVANQVTWWLNGTTVTSETGVAPNALTWDDTNNYFGIQTAAPLSILHVGNFTTSGTVDGSSILIGKPIATSDVGAGAVVSGGSETPNEASGIDSFVTGSGSSATADHAFASGDGTTASGVASHSEGNGTTASGTDSHAEGTSTLASATSAHAEGNGTTASGVSSHAEGDSTTAAGADSHAEGNGSQTTVAGTAAHAEGLNTTASAANAHAEGNSTTASGADSHAEGDSTTASGADSHAEGKDSEASGAAAHAEGNDTTASGDFSHSQGSLTTASGQASHAQGTSTTAGGLNSHAGGTESEATGDYSYVSGRKAKDGGAVGTRVVTDSQNFETTADSADSYKARFDGGWDYVKGGGADNDDGVNYRIRQESGTSNSATPVDIQTVAIPNNSVVLIESRVVGARTGGTAGAVGDSASYVRTVKAKNIAGTVTVLKRQADYTSEDQRGWKCRHEVSGTDIAIQCTGAANNDVKWHVTTKIQIVTF